MVNINFYVIRLTQLGLNHNLFLLISNQKKRSKKANILKAYLLN